MMWSAIVLGFLGSVHCLAMCGPLVLTLNQVKKQLSIDKFYYNAGRITTYGVLGLLAGVFGTGLQWAVGQQLLSIFSGVLLIIGLLVSWSESRKLFNWSGKMLAWLKLRMAGILDGNRGKVWWLGMYNGLLPCGLTYVALAASVSMGNLSKALIYMVLFGLGTVPMMWMVVVVFQRVRLKWTHGDRLTTLFTWVLALLLILRGLDLGVPYLSPDNSGHSIHITVCN